MYNFIFNWIYRYHEKGGNTVNRETASGAVALTILIHVFLILKIIEICFEVNFSYNLTDSYSTNKILLFPFGLVYFSLFSWFYTKKRAIRIVKNYKENYQLYTVINFMWLCIMVVVPLVLLICLTNNHLK